ncbi:MAG: hypothetical protein ACOVQJ_00965 [Bacteroidia bacterium]|jgi:hypothetical protein
MKSAAITFDLDLVDHLNGGEVDEMATAFPLFRQFCEQHPEIKTTWFIRIDDQMEARFGSADYIFIEHAEKLEWLKDNGHELGWHFHSFREDNGNWIQNTDEVAVAEELIRHRATAQKHNLELLRMGWTYHTNLTMKTISSFGLLADCSALPRPDYVWEISKRSWANTPTNPYFPSVEDYRTAGNPCYATLEFPLTVLPITAPYDTESGVLRYLNPAYHTDIFCKAVDSYDGDMCNLISHPYEFLPSEKQHAMLSFSFESFKKNIEYLQHRGFTFCVLSSQIHQHLNQ